MYKKAKKSIKYIQYNPKTKILKKVKKTSLERGIISEKMVAKALKELKSEGEIINFSKGNKYLDWKKGIDFVVINKEGQKLFLNAKSSTKGKKEGYRKHTSDINFIVRKPGEGVKEVKEKIINILKR